MDEDKKTHSYFPQLLSILISVGFFACVFWVAAYPQDDTDRDILNILLGMLGAGFNQVISYWLGGTNMDKKK